MNIILALLVLIMLIPSSQHQEIKAEFEFDPILENTIPAIEPLPEIITVEPEDEQVRRVQDEKRKRRLLPRLLRKTRKS
jgi:hypothetical protein